MTVTTTNSRHLLIKLDSGARLPDDVVGALRDEVVLAGWLRGGGSLDEVELRVGSSVRKLTGALHAISIEGSIGLVNGDVTVGLRAVLARDTDAGPQTFAGEIVRARVASFEAHAVAFDDVTATRRNDALDTLTVSASPAPSTPALPAVVAAPPPQAAPPPPQPAPAPPPVAVVPPSEPEIAKPKPSPTFSNPNAMPMRPVKAAVAETEDEPAPDAGDVVEHFAFGRCEVVKSDGDRLHIRLGKDGRIKEVALEMLKVTPLPDIEGQAGKHWKLDRRL